MRSTAGIAWLEVHDVDTANPASALINHGLRIRGIAEYSGLLLRCIGGLPTDGTNAESRGTEPAHEFSGIDFHRAEIDGVLPQPSGQIVMITMKRSAGQSQVLGEAMQLLEARIAHEMGKAGAMCGPDRPVDEDHCSTIGPHDWVCDPPGGTASVGTLRLCRADMSSDRGRLREEQRSDA